jgi:hypothetical protein
MWKAQDAIRRRSWEGCRRGCYHQAVKTFEELKLWNDMIFFDVPKHRHFVCSQCGGRHVKMMPIFPPARGTPGYGSGA